MSFEAPRVFRLTAYHQFKAAHTLEGFHVPHFHLWKVSIEFERSFPLENDRVVDLVHAESILEKILNPLRGRLLDEELKISPTSENLCVWIWESWQKRAPELGISAVSVTLCDLEGRAAGKAELRR